MNNLKQKTKNTQASIKTDLRNKASGKRSFSFKGGDFGSAGGGGIWFDKLQEAAQQYIRRTPIIGQESFSTAFKRARDNGESIFLFNGKEYTTEVSDNPNYIGKRYQDKIDAVVREVLDENQQLIKDSTRLELYVGQPLGVYKRNGK